MVARMVGGGSKGDGRRTRAWGKHGGGIEVVWGKHGELEKKRYI